MSGGFIGRVATLQTRMSLGMASLALNILALLMPISILLIFDRVIPFQSMETLRVLTLMLLVGAAMEFTLRWSRSALLSTSAEDAAVANYGRFLNKILYADTSEFSREPGSAFIERFSAIAQFRDYSSGQNQTLVIDLPFTCVFAVLIGLIGGWLILVPAAALCVVLIFSYVMKRAQWSLFSVRKQIDTRRYAFLSELLGNMPTIKANRMERQMTRRFELLEDQTVDLSRKLIQFAGFAQSFGAIFSQLAVAAMGLFGAYLVISDVIGMSELAACMMLNGRIIQPLTKLMSLWVQADNVAVAQARLNEVDVLKTQEPRCDDHLPKAGHLTVRDLSVARSNGQGRPFAATSFQICQGTNVLFEIDEAWMAPACFDAIAGQDAGEQGLVLIDSKNAKDCVAWRGEDAIVMLETDPAIFSGTLLDNLSAFGDAERVRRAKKIAAQLGLERRINRLPMGYSTKLNTGTAFEKNPVNRQLIALTRALAIRPKILMMIEPTSVLDTPERDALAQCLRSLGDQLTLLIASPDPRMKRLCTMTVSLENDHDAELSNWQVDAEQDAQAARLSEKGVA